jgi:hypothetical protein
LELCIDSSRYRKSIVLIRFSWAGVERRDHLAATVNYSRMRRSFCWRQKINPQMTQPQTTQSGRNPRLRSCASPMLLPPLTAFSARAKMRLMNSYAPHSRGHNAAFCSCRQRTQVWTSRNTANVGMIFPPRVPPFLLCAKTQNSRNPCQRNPHTCSGQPPQR